MSAIVVYVTASSWREARKLTDVLIRERLAACVSIVPVVHSTYWWKGKIERAREVLLIIKTRRDTFTRLSRRIQAVHSYTVPEILALPVIRGNKTYLRWLQQSVSHDNTSMQLILASKSPRRRSLLKTLGLPFRVVPSGVPETASERRPEKLVRELALRKAKAVAQKVKQGLILGADTIVVLRGEILGQPKDSDDAYRILFRLSGTTHRVFTGVALVDVIKRTAKTAVAISTVRMKPLSIDTLLRLSHKNLDKAGAYAIQSQHDPIARVVQGDYDNVVGLPLAVVKRLLKPYRRAKTLPKRRMPS